MKHRLLSVMLVMALGLSLLSVNALALELPDLDVLEDVVATVEEAGEEPAVVIEETAPVLDNDGNVAINEENFPDDIFRAYVQEEFDYNKDWVLTESEITCAISISCENMEISSLKGIEWFSNLVSLFCRDNNLAYLDISNNLELRYLGCDNNNLGGLDVSNNLKLSNLYCAGNNLSDLDVSDNIELEQLVCGSNELVSLNVCNNLKLTDLECSHNNLSSLDVSNNAMLEQLYCAHNNLDGLNVNDNTLLAKFVCVDNNLKYLDISRNSRLEILQCNGNDLRELNISNNPLLIDWVINGVMLNDYGYISYGVYNDVLIGYFEERLSIDSTVTLIDGIPDAAELTALMKHIVGEEELAGAMAYDYNDDGVVDILDVIRAVRYLSGEEVELN